MHFHDCKGQVSSADINSKGNVLVLGLDNGIVRLYSIAALDKIYSFKELKMTHGSRIDQLLFSTIGDQLAVLSKAEDRIYYLLVNLLLPI